MSDAEGALVGMNSRKVKWVFFGILLVIALVVATIGINRLVFLDDDSWIAGRRLSTALRDARAVTLLEFLPYQEKEPTGVRILARKEATPEEISRLREATRLWFLPFLPYPFLCYTPRHSIEITEGNGVQTTVDICFSCEKFLVVGEGHLAELPPNLKKSLAMFFTSVGMKPKTEDEYSALERVSPQT
jgi:hypothetical protein